MEKTVRAGRSRGAAVGGLAVALVAVGAPAQANPPTETFQETWDDTVTEVCDLGTADTSDDITIESRYVGSVDFVIRERGRSGLAYFTVDGQESSTYTNVDTGLAWTGENRWHEKDLKIAEDADGILTIRFGSVFHFQVFSPEGIPGGVNTGRFEAVVVYDPATDTEISFTERKNVGAQTVMEFCEDAIRYTT